MTLENDVVIVGGSVAGLSAALVLGRCGRKVLVYDDGQPRNAVSRGVHGFLSRDGILPAELLRVSREQLEAYPSVTVRAGRVDRVERLTPGFRLHVSQGEHPTAHKVLLATGLVDDLPPIAGIHQYWGKSVFTCPFCDGWEVRGQRFVVIGHCAALYDFALELRQWATEVIVCTDGAPLLTSEQQSHLGRLGVRVQLERVLAIEGAPPQVERVRLQDGNVIDTRVVFMTTRQRQRSELVQELGCELDGDGAVPVRECDCWAAEDVWVAGNASSGLQMAIIAAAEGVKAAHAINESLVVDALRGT